MNDDKELELYILGDELGERIVKLSSEIYPFVDRETSDANLREVAKLERQFDDLPDKIKMELRRDWFEEHYDM